MILIKIFPRKLKKGSKGDDVKKLQQALGGLTIDGVFGAKTLAKVKSYQKSLWHRTYCIS